MSARARLLAPPPLPRASPVPCRTPPVQSRPGTLPEATRPKPTKLPRLPGPWPFSSCRSGAASIEFLDLATQGNVDTKERKSWGFLFTISFLDPPLTLTAARQA
ncbi:hypothetical protein U9M48_031977 [Paspalum notatum var. saurae]|uniref:Uncharacterized protein n=1 Tax=Paspalum notatum var. saurae TaxID=547442 RepID=A0AAQ3U4B5_PASNO